MAVHVLFQGRVLCNDPELDDIPREWPAGEMWVDLANHEKASCLPCQRQAKALIEEKPCQKAQKSAQGK